MKLRSFLPPLRGRGREEIARGDFSPTVAGARQKAGEAGWGGRVAFAALVLAIAIPVLAASRAPLVLNGPQTQQLQSSDSLKLPNVTGSVQCLHADAAGAVTGTAADCGSGAGTVTNIATGAGLTGGPITSTGAIALATIADGDVLANVSGATAAPADTTINALLDHVFGATQGSVIYRGASGWNELTPGTSGYFLETQGASANPQWAAAGCTFANPTATARDTAVNGAATTCMRSDAAPAVQLGSSSQFGIVKVDGVTITASAGVISSVAPATATTLWSWPWNGTSTFTHSFACSGNLISPQRTINVVAVAAGLTTVTGATYKIGIAPYDTVNNKITSAPTYAVAFTEGTGIANAWVTGNFGPGFTIAGASNAIVFICRTDAGTTPSTTLQTVAPLPSGITVPAFILTGMTATNKSFHLASAAPTTSDVWTTETGWYVFDFNYGY